MATPPPGDEITVTVTSDPRGAKVYRADKSEAETQTTPVVFKMRRGAPPFDIQLRADGYAPQTRTITSDGSIKLVVALARLPAAPPPPVEAKTVPKPDTPPRSAARSEAKADAQGEAPSENRSETKTAAAPVSNHDEAEVAPFGTQEGGARS